MPLGPLITIPTDYAPGRLVTDVDLRMYRTAITQLATWPAWTTMSLATGWAVYVSTPKYRTDPTGQIIDVAGNVSSAGGLTGIGNPIATLPSGYRPANPCIYVTAMSASSPAMGVVIVNATGVMYVDSGTTTGYVSLSPISFAIDE